MIANSTLDPRVRRYVLPTRVVWQQEGAVPSGLSERLLSPNHTATVLKYDGAAAPAFLLDFGQELHGGIQIENGITPDHTPIRVRVRFGESVTEAMGDPNNDHAVHNTVCEVPWYGTAEIGNTGFRFAYLEMLDHGVELHLMQVRAVFIYRDLEYKGSFRCNDERLNQIWMTGARTVHLCMQDMLWDGAKRDRLVWLGDMHPETQVISAVFGDVDIVPKSLDFVRDRTPLPGWMNGISSYSLWWVIIQHDWYMNHGNIDYLETQRPYLLKLLEILIGEIDGENRERLGNHRFLDWPSSEDAAAIHAGLHALLSMALEAGAQLCYTLGEHDMQPRCLAAARQLRLHTPEAVSSKQANALLVLAGHADAAETNRAVLAAHPLWGLSTFYGYYVLQARALAGDYDGCLDIIRQYWGAMLDHGATTFWEDFDLSWTQNGGRIDEITPAGKKDIHADYGNYCYKGLRHSLCHGWAAGPTAWLTEHVLGFKVLEPGCRSLLVAPHLGNLEFAEGAFPTPQGVAHVRHVKKSNGEVESTCDAPEGVRVLLNGKQ